MGAYMSCLTNITTFEFVIQEKVSALKTFGAAIFSCTLSAYMIEYVFSFRGAMGRIPLRSADVDCKPEARRAHRTKPTYHQAMASSRPDGLSDGWPKSIQKYFSDKKVLSCRTGPGRTAFSVLWTLFPVLSDGSAGCPRAKKYFSKKKYSVHFRIMTVSHAMSSRLPLGPCTWKDMLPLRWNSHQAARKQIADYLTHECISPWVIFRKILVHSDDVSVAAIIFLGKT